MSVALKLFL